MSRKHVFITYSHPSDRQDESNRRIVARHVGRYFRNRSAPTTQTRQRDQSRQGRQHLQALVPIPHDRFGTRSDPFKSAPANHHASACVPAAIDYFVHGYAPTHFILNDLTIIDSFFQYAMQRPYLFDAIVCLSLCHVVKHRTLGRRPDPEMLVYYGRSITGLRQALEGHAQDDAVPAAILTLMTVDLMCADFQAFRSHLHGIRRVVEKRGGVEHLGFQAIIEPLYHRHSKFWGYVMHSLEAAPPSPPHIATALPPRLQISSKLLEQVTPGVCRLAEQGVIRPAVLETERQLMIRYAECNDGATPPGRDCRSLAIVNHDLGEVAGLLIDLSLTKEERWLCIALAFHGLRASSVGSATNIYLKILKKHCEEMLTSTMTKLNDTSRRLFLYVLLVLLGSVLEVSSEDEKLNGLAVRLMRKDKAMMCWTDLSLALEQFVPGSIVIKRYHVIWQKARSTLQHSSS